MNAVWKKGRGKLGVFDSLLGTWVSTTRSGRGTVRCTRSFTRVLSNRYVQMATRWVIRRVVYEEVALFCVGPDRRLCFWSFTSDGKHSTGVWADVREVHAEAVGFESQMPAGLARMVFWPSSEGGVYWAVESKGKKGWKRFVEHHFVRAEGV